MTNHKIQYIVSQRPVRSLTITNSRLSWRMVLIRLRMKSLEMSHLSSTLDKMEATCSRKRCASVCTFLMSSEFTRYSRSRLLSRDCFRSNSARAASSALWLASSLSFIMVISRSKFLFSVRAVSLSYTEKNCNLSYFFLLLLFFKCSECYLMIHAGKHTSLRLSISDVNLVATFCSLPTSDTNLIIVSLLALLSNSVLFTVSFSVTILPFSKAFSCTRSVICNFEKHNDKLITRHLFHLNLKKSRGHNSLIFLEIKPTFLIISSTVNVALDISSTEMILDN